MTTTTITPQKAKRTLKSYFPIFNWLPKYRSSWLQFEIIAALTVWALDAYLAKKPEDIQDQE